MQLPFPKKSLRAEAGCGQEAGVSKGLVAVCILLGVGSAVAWLLPGPKNNAVWGRYDYSQFWWAVAFSLGTISALVVAAAPARSRRGVGFRLGATWLGIILGLILVEGAASFLPVRNQMDNPWYFAAGGGIKESDELPFERPAHLQWQGSSRGDLAQLNGDPDPYARTITFETDWEGFHNHEDIQQADVVTVGDSFTEAGNVPVEENFTTLIGRKLGLKSRNLGRAGYSPPLELMVLRKYGLSCRPKIVVWQIAEANDLDDSLRYQKWVEAGRPPFFDANADKQWLRTKAWEQRSPTYRFFDLIRNHDPRPWPFDGVFRDHAGVEHPMRFINKPVLQYAARIHPGWATFARALTEGAAICRSNQIQLVIVLVPDKYRVLGPSTHMLNPEVPDLAASVAVPTAEALGGVLKPLCDSLGVAFVDASLPLEAHTKAGELVYLPYDTHLSPRGHEVVAEAVVARLRPDAVTGPAQGGETPAEPARAMSR